MRLKERVLLFLFRLTGKHLHEHSQELWYGRRVIIADGSTVTMDDAPANQEEYPRPASQAAGCGGRVYQLRESSSANNSSNLLYKCIGVVPPPPTFICAR